MGDRGLPDKIFISLPVTDVARARAFYQALGWSIDPAMSDEGGVCVIVSEAIYLMLASHARFQAISPKPMLLPRDGVSALIALACGTREEVHRLSAAAIVTGGRALHEAEDLGFMYSRAFEDPDGNGFGPFWVQNSDKA